MSYKHGSWRCKPANEAEAKEIVERAVASGAELYETVGSRSDRVYEWNAYPHWGVFGGETTTGRAAWGDLYTITEIREKFPLPGEHAEQGWNGEGLPPVGVDVEVRFNGEWHKTYVIGYSREGFAVCAGIDSRWPNSYCSYWSPRDFRPIRSERDQWVNAAHKIANDGSGSATFRAIGAVYDAIRSGDLKAPEVE